MSDCWWPIALSEDVPPGLPFPVTCAGTELVLFRDRQSVIRALRDECAHRRAPLSLGKVTRDGFVECPYHGWRYDGATGACVAIPNLSAGEPVPKAYRVAAFATHEEHGFVQVALKPREEISPPAVLDLRLATTNSGSCLIAYPWEALVDLLLDAPSAVIAIPGVAVVDDHRYGEPTLEEDGTVVISHAAEWQRGSHAPRKAIPDYPLSFRAAVSRSGNAARVEVSTDQGELVAACRFGIAPVRKTLTKLCWRGAGTSQKGTLIEIGACRQIDPEKVLSSVAHASKLRDDAKGSAPTGTAAA